MGYRPLGRTGVQVSKLWLGTIMFGAWGNTDHDDSVRIIRGTVAEHGGGEMVANLRLTIRNP